MFNPIWGFNFKVSIDKHIVILEPGKQISIPVVLQTLRGKAHPVNLDVNTRWESVGLSAQILPSQLNPSQLWEATMIIKAKMTTPPGSYLFTVRGGTGGTFNTSEDAVTVIVEKNAEQKTDEPDFFHSSQPNQPAGVSHPGSTAGEPSFSLDNLFAPQKKEHVPGGQLSGQKPPKNSAVAWIIAILIGLGIFFGLAVKNKNFEGGGGVYECTCQNGSVCTKNSDCPYMAPGVPGICGCPVR